MQKQRECHITRGTEIGGPHLEAREHQGSQQSPLARETKKGPSLEPSEEAQPCGHLDVRLLPPEL